MNRVSTFITIFFLSCASAFATDLQTIKSPDGNLIFTLSAKSKVVQFSVKYKEKVVLHDSPLQLQLSNGLLFNDRTVIGKPLLKQVDEYYTLQVGKASRIRNHYNE